jgi:4-hydroxybenzoate polyprenyltransferase
MKGIKNYLKLMRPANIMTAIADILLGYAASGAIAFAAMGAYQLNDILLWLILSTIGLYGGGVVLNDVFDAQLDAVERPERPIPSGSVPIKKAILLGAFLLLLGVGAAFMASLFSGVLAFVISLLVVLYDSYGKHQKLFGPINMGACRGMNLMLGVSALPGMLYELWFIAFIPVLYIAAITMISRGEVHGGNKKIISGALMMYLIVVLCVVALCFLPYYKIIYTLPFLFLFLLLTFSPLISAFKKPGAQEIRKAVKASVLALIALNATMAAGFAGWQYGLMVICLLPVSIGLARFFAVT